MTIRRFTSALLALLVTLALIPAAGGITASANDLKHIFVEIKQAQTVAQIQTAINSALARSDVGVVAIEGKKTNATGTLALIIPDGKAVYWTADYASTADISVSGQNGSMAVFYVLGDGKISSSASRGAIRVQDGNTAMIHVSSGLPRGRSALAENTAGYPAISVAGGSIGYVLVSDGGRVKSGGTAIDFEAGCKGAAAYLAGTVETDMYTSNVLTIETAELVIPRTHTGTNNGLTIKGGSGAVNWYSLGLRPALEYSDYINGDSGLLSWWGEFAHTITLDPQGGEVTPNSVYIENYSLYDFLPVPARDGKFFAGWYTQASGGVKASGYIQLMGDITLYARWIDMPDCVYCLDAGCLICHPPPQGIYGTKPRWNGKWWHYVLFFACFGWIWMMWF